MLITKKFRIVQYDDVVVWGEFINGALYISIDPEVEAMTPMFYKELFSVWAITQAKLVEKGFYEVFAIMRDEPRYVKFASMFGFDPLLVYKDEAGNPYIKSKCVINGAA